MEIPLSRAASKMDCYGVVAEWSGWSGGSLFGTTWWVTISKRPPVGVLLFLGSLGSLSQGLVSLGVRVEVGNNRR